MRYISTKDCSFAEKLSIRLNNYNICEIWCDRLGVINSFSPHHVPHMIHAFVTNLGNDRNVHEKLSREHIPFFFSTVFCAIEFFLKPSNST